MKINNIQAMRGIACLLVFGIHALLSRGGLGVDTISWYLYPIGSAGVDIFFVISGFIITTVAVSSASAGALDFGLRRLIRIYPMYWIVFAVALIASRYMTLAPPTMPERSLPVEALLLTHDNAVVLVAWSLAFEMYFYFVVTALLALAPKRFIPALLTWCAVSLAAMIYCAFVATNWDWYEQIPQSPLILEFMFGIVIACAMRANILPLGATSIALGCVALLIGCDVIRINDLHALPPWWRTLCFGAPAAMIVYGVVAVEIRRGWTISRLWQNVGDASYSIYIWHHLLLASLMAVFVRLNLLNFVPGFVLILASAAIVFSFGLLSFHYVERPMTKWLLARLPAVSRRASAAAPGQRRRGGAQFEPVYDPSQSFDRSRP